MIDYYTVTAGRILNKHPDKVTIEERQEAKKVFFTDMYNTFTGKIKAEIKIKLSRVEDSLEYYKKFRTAPDNPTQILLMEKEKDVLLDILEDLNE